MGNKNKIPKCIVPFHKYKLDNMVRDYVHTNTQNKSVVYNEAYVIGMRTCEIAFDDGIYYRIPPKTGGLLSEICDERLGGWICSVNDDWYWFHQKNSGYAREYIKSKENCSVHGFVYLRSEEVQEKIRQNLKEFTEEYLSKFNEKSLKLSRIVNF